MATYVIGVALGYRQLLVLAAGGLLAIALSAGFVLWRPRVQLNRQFHPATVTAGDAAAAVLEVVNLSRWPSPPITVLDRVGTVDIRLPVPGLGPGRASLVRYPLPTDRRGRIALGPLGVERSDPFGLLTLRQDHGSTDVLWVHPRTWPMGPLAAGVVVDFEGPVSEASPKGSLTFSSLREYVPGDDRRQIHWRSSARLGTMMVRQHVDANEPRATVVLDTRWGVWTADSFEEGIEVAASVADALSGRGHPVQLRILGEAPGEARRAGARTVADRLAAAGWSPGASAGALLSLLEQAPDGGSLVIVSGAMEAAVESRLGPQSRRYAPVILCTVGPILPARWQRRASLIAVSGPDALAVARAWNRMVRQ